MIKTVFHTSQTIEKNSDIKNNIKNTAVFPHCSMFDVSEKSAPITYVKLEESAARNVFFFF